MKEKHSWGWPIAIYLFLGGLGGGAMVVSSAADLFFDKGAVFSLGSLLAGLFIAVGSSFLIFELGRPLQFWRVFSAQKAIMTVGAWMLSVSIVTSILYFSFWPESSPWRGMIGLRHALATINLLLGLGVCIYTGVLLGSLKARRFWNTPVLPILFLISGLSTAVAAHSLLAGTWPYAQSRDGLESIHAALRFFDLTLIALESMIVLVYVMMMRFYAGADAARTAASWLNGSKRWTFWICLIWMGLLLPAIIYVLAGTAGHVWATLFVLIGGISLRFLVVYSDERTRLPGEARYYARLPERDAPFLRAWE